MAENKYDDIGAVPVEESKDSSDYSDIGAVPVEQSSTSSDDKTSDMGYFRGIANQALGGIPLIRDAVQAAVGTAAYRSALPEGVEDLDDKGNPIGLLDRYYEIKKDIQKQHNAFAKENPKASTVAQLAGGMATPLGALGKVAKTASTLQKYGQIAKSGALLGGLYGLDASTGQLFGSDAAPLDAGIDTAKGALGGALFGPLVMAAPNSVKLGAGLGAAGLAGYNALTGNDEGFKQALPLAMLAGAGLVGGRKAVINAGKKSDSPYIQELQKAYKLEKDGTRLAGAKAKELLEQEVNETATDLLDDLLKGRKTASNKVGEILKAHEQNKVDIKPVLEKSYQEALNLPASTPKEIADKKQVLETLQNMLFGSEMQKTQTVVPGAYSVKPGKTIKGGEETILEKLQGAMAKISAKQQAKVPEKQAQQSLKQQFSRKELLAEENGLPKFSPDKVENVTTSAGDEALTAIGPEGDKLAAILKGTAKPGEIQTYVDPNTGKKVMGFIDDTGKLVAHVVPDQAPFTPVSITKSPDRVVTTTERTGGSTNLTPQEVKNRAMAVRDLTAIGESPVQSRDSKDLVRRLQTDLETLLADSLPDGSRAGLHSEEAGINKFSNVLEMLGVKPNGPLTEADKVQLQNRLGSFIRGLEQEGNTAQSRKHVLDNVVKQLKEVAPDLAAYVEHNVAELSERYDLTKKMNRSGIGHGMDAFLGPVKSVTEKGAALLGRGVGNIDRSIEKAGKSAFNVGEKAGQSVSPYAQNASKMAGATAKFISNATPETIKQLIPKVSAPYQKVLTQISNPDVPEQTRRALLFSLMQQPAFRNSVGDIIGTMGEMTMDDKSDEQAE